MKHRWLTLFVLPAFAMALGGCLKPETPQEVATDFWQALTEGEAGDAAELSTLADSGVLEGLDGNLPDTLPDFGRVVIDGDQATIVTRVPADEVEDTTREITTYLVQIEDQWLVDFRKTIDSATTRSPLSGLMGDINRLGKQLDDAVGRSSERFSDQVDRMAEDFRTYSDETGKKAEKALESFGRSLEDLRKQIEDSLEEAEKERRESEQSDQQSLEQAAI